MRKLTLQDLRECFSTAEMKPSKYIGIEITTEGSRGSEVIINPTVNFENKLSYYEKAYTDDLVLKSFNGISITGFAFGDSYGEIQTILDYNNMKPEFASY